MKKPVVIIGAGLAGLAAAYELGDNTLVLESGGEVGGVARTSRHGDFSYDLGPHVLYFRNRRIQEFVSQILNNQWVKQQRRARIMLSGETVDYPIQEGFMQSTVLKERYLSGILEAAGQRSKTFTETALNLYGRGLADDFFIPYNKKLWQHPLDDMDEEKMAEYLPAFHADDLKLLAKGETPARGANACFFYPDKGGIGTLAKKIADNLSCEVKLSAEAAILNTGENRVETID
ncbi:NAD(P)-binding protein, partial [candidate division WOR-3 bacterium]|nr:NAD(P)-binding protein [candidate division WOR-3 bacterium]MBD3365442.1 NAD(P)-binding protein [candidate division WOR-3 bacterium]